MSVALLLMALRGGNGAPPPNKEFQFERELDKIATRVEDEFPAIGEEDLETVGNPTDKAVDDATGDLDFERVAAQVAKTPPRSRWTYQQTTAAERSRARRGRNIEELSKSGDQNKEDFDRVAELVASDPPPSRWYGMRPRAERTEKRLGTNIASLKEARGA